MRSVPRSATVGREVPAAWKTGTIHTSPDPDVTENVQRLVEQLDATPAMIEVTDPATEQVAPVPVDGAALATILFGLFYIPDGPATIPFLVTSLAAGA